jgi:hypothetical protein
MTHPTDNGALSTTHGWSHQQLRGQGGAFDQGIEVDEFTPSVGIVADGTEAVEGGGVEAGGVAIGAAPGGGLVEGEAQVIGGSLGYLPES